MIANNSNGPRHAAWRDHHWWSKDGIRLHARVYGTAAAAEPAGAGAEAAGAAGAAGSAAEGATPIPGLPILCLSGLTRNARDFDRLAPHCAERRAVYAIDFRGRGDSGYAKDAMTYGPLTYVQDVVALLDELACARCIVVGTSLGGIVAMLLAATQPGRVAGAVLNDIGPVIEPAGLDRIRDRKSVV